MSVHNVHVLPPLHHPSQIRTVPSPSCPCEDNYRACAMVYSDLPFHPLRFPLVLDMTHLEGFVLLACTR